MFQCQEQKTDIYQILSFCLGYLKRKIVLFIKIFLNEKNFSQKPELLTELANQQLFAQKYIDLLRKTNEKFIQENDQKLFGRFINRIKQLIRNYLPHTNIFYQLFTYLKKIEAFPFKQNCYIEYILYILQQNPANIEKDIIIKVKQIKNNLKQIPNISNHFYQNHSFIKTTYQHHRYKFTNHHQEEIKLNCLNRKTLSNEDIVIKTSQNQQSKIQNQLRPIDIFIKCIDPIQNCMDFDISHIRGIYFNLQKEKQNLKTTQKSFENTNKAIQLIEDQMIQSNRYIKESIKSFDRQFTKYQTKLNRSQTQFKIMHPRCQTANPSKKYFNQSSLTNHLQKTAKSRSIISQNKKSMEPLTFENISSQQQRIELSKEIHKKRNNVLKMKSISVSAQKGHLQLCSQNKQQSKKMSLTFTNFKRGVNYNNRKNEANNLKKKYQIFMNSCISSIIKKSPPLRNNESKLEQQFVLENVKDFPNDWNYKTIEVNKNSHKSKNLKNKQFQTVSIKGVEALVFIDKKFTYKCESQLSNHNETKKDKTNELLTVEVSSKKQSQNLHKFNDLDNTIKTFMKGINVNHRNYANIHYRSKRLFDTLNPQLSIKTLKKS